MVTEQVSQGVVRRHRNTAGHLAARNARSIDELIDVYWKYFSQGRTAELLRYENLHFPRALELAAKALIPSSDRPSGFAKEPHQWRLRAADLKNGYLRLKALRLDLLRPKTFASLLAATRRVSSKTEGLGEMWAFDTAFRLSISFDCMPEGIYLHAGCRKGATNLLGRAVFERAPIVLFGRAGKRLGPAHLESFLCTLKEYLNPKLLAREMN